MLAVPKIYTLIELHLAFVCGRRHTNAELLLLLYCPGSCISSIIARAAKGVPRAVMSPLHVGIRDPSGTAGVSRAVLLLCEHPKKLNGIVPFCRYERLGKDVCRLFVGDNVVQGDWLSIEQLLDAT